MLCFLVAFSITDACFAVSATASDSIQATLAPDSVFFPLPEVSPPVSGDSFFGTPHHLQASEGMEALERAEPFPRDWMIWIMAAGLIAVAMSRYYFPTRVKNIFRAVIGLRLLYLLHKEGGFFRETPTYLLYVNFLLVISLLIFQTLRATRASLPWDEIHPAVLYGGILLFFLLFYLLKFLLTGFLAWVFYTRKASMLYFTNLFVMNQFTGLLVMPLVFYHAVIPSATSLYAAWVLVILLNVYKVIRGGILGHTISDFSVYYLFLYLCGVELAPLLIIGKAASVYLFN